MECKLTQTLITGKACPAPVLLLGLFGGFYACSPEVETNWDVLCSFCRTVAGDRRRERGGEGEREGGGRERERERQTDRQTDRQPDRHTDRQTDRHTHTPTDRQTDTDRES